MSAGGTPSNVKLGPGRIWIGPVGSTAPTNASSAPDTAFWALGYTEEGTTVDIESSGEPIEVAEELDPIDFVLTARSVTLNVAAAEVTRKRLAVALALGASYADNAAALDFPSGSDTQVGVAVIWDSAETAAGNSENIRWYIPKMMPSDTSSIARQKAPNKSTLPLVLNAIKTASYPIARVFPNASGLV